MFKASIGYERTIAVVLLLSFLLAALIVLNSSYGYFSGPAYVFSAEGEGVSVGEDGEGGEVNVEDEQGNVSVDDEGNVIVDDGEGNVGVDDDGNVIVDDGEGNVTVDGDNVTVSGTVVVNRTNADSPDGSLSVEVSARTDGEIIIGSVSLERLSGFGLVSLNYSDGGDADGTASEKGRGSGDDEPKGPLDLGFYFEVEATDSGIGNIHLEIDMSGKIPAGVDTECIKLYWLDEERGEWIKIETSCYNETTGKLEADVDHLTIFAPMVETQQRAGQDSRSAGVEMIIVIVAVIMAVFLVIFVLLRRKGKGEEEERGDDHEGGGEEVIGERR